MAFLFDFGISQEDPLSEQFVLNIQPYDRILSLASGGEVPLSLLSLTDNLMITAVDVSEQQVMLCRLKLLAAQYIDFPVNGRFLGYAKLEGRKRCQLYREVIRPRLSVGDTIFWDRHLKFIEKGIINAGRFEQYIKKMRFVSNLVIGKSNLSRLITCQSIGDQDKVFQDHIATRKSLQLLFRIAFHPAIYKKRGLQEQALIHAGKSTGERFYSRFRDFCTSSLASENYFLQYFLTGSCVTEESFPAYLQPDNKNRLLHNLDHFELINISLQNALCDKEKGYFNKIHLSNLGDWLTKDQFSALLALISLSCNPGTRICYRYLQKNHFPETGTGAFIIDNTISDIARRKDRFPFYNILSITFLNEPEKV